MNDNNGKELKDIDESLASQRERGTPRTPANKRTAVVAIVAIAGIVALAFLAWVLWPSKSGKPVPAPRTVSFGESSSPQTAITNEQILVLTPEQLQRAGLKI